ncbi:four-carbon acid sugar kinase family protein [Nonomuraea sp. 3-1Str]|uniref:four-carbon acid sugar kinase family protein n=1 Tax=Nonomuraea sp. 3-1Str TaxID=2929801 RepID=UPI00285AAD9F|nr:four-carbon acid sugar kinase family protein [Nonomuraea sp. 3-1Str]MDR8409458.1 four-carbon acid sugar kinase family protein [Nonomuraea sp. 3-1Str]
MRTLPSIAVVADDLTSAGDAAAPFHLAGFPAWISLEAAVMPPAGTVMAVDCDTRALPAADAAARVTRVVRQLTGADVLVKTVDSTARGHLAAEIAAALSAGGRATAVIAPAFPAEGRSTVGGVQHLAGVPVHRTAFAQDPGHPVRDADLTRLVPGAVLADGSGHLAGLAGRARYVVADAVSDRDLDEIVAAVDRPREVLWVGSPGLAEALARHLAPGRHPGRTCPMRRHSTRSRVLTVVGSLHPASRGQAERLGALGVGAMVPVAAAHAAQWAERELDDYGAALLHGPADWAATGSVPAALAAVVSLLATRRAFDALVLTGGETARTVLDALAVRAVRLAGQAEPGVPLGVVDHPWRFPVALKAGGFGDLDTLARLTDLLTTSAPAEDPCAP